MCFSSPKPPSVPPPDPAIEEQKKAQFEENAARLTEQKNKAVDDARARANGFAYYRSLLGTSPAGSLMAIYGASQTTRNMNGQK